MATTIPFHLIERDPESSFVRWLYIFDRGGRRHLLAISRVELVERRPRLMVHHELFRRDCPRGPLEATSLEKSNFSSRETGVAFIDSMVDHPLELGEPVAAFLQDHLHRMAAHAGNSAHEIMSMIEEFRENLEKARNARRRAAVNRRDRLARMRSAGIVPTADLKGGRLVRLCPKHHGNLSAEMLAATFRVFRRSPRARNHSLVAIDGPLKGRHFYPPGCTQVYLAADK